MTKSNKVKFFDLAPFASFLLDDGTKCLKVPIGPTPPYMALSQKGALFHLPQHIRVFPAPPTVIIEGGAVSEIRNMPPDFQILDLDVEPGDPLFSWTAETARSFAQEVTVSIRGESLRGKIFSRGSQGARISLGQELLLWLTWDRIAQALNDGHLELEEDQNA